MSNSSLDFLKELMAEERQKKSYRKSQTCPICLGEVPIIGIGREGVVCRCNHYLVFYDGYIFDSDNYVRDDQERINKSRDGQVMLLKAIGKIIDNKNVLEDDMINAMIYCDNNDISLMCETIPERHPWLSRNIINMYDDNNGSLFIPVYLNPPPDNVENFAWFRFCDLKRFIGECERAAGIIFEPNTEDELLVPSDLFAYYLYPGAYLGL